MEAYGKNVVWMGTLNDRALLIYVNGEWDLSVADDLGRIFEEVGTGRDVVLDLRGVTFMDSTILSQVISLHKRLDAAGHRLETISTGVIKRLFSIVSLDKLIDVSPKRIESVDAVHRGIPAKQPATWES